MKKYILPSLLLFAASAVAQTVPNTMYLNLKNGNTIEYNIAEIQDITFGVTGDIPPVEKMPSFTVPESFASGAVQTVSVAGKQVAEICQEYIKSIAKQVVVVYPCGEDGKADLTKGITTTGASVVWDLSANTATVGEEGDAVSTFYIVDGELTTSYAGETVEAKVAPYVLLDARGSEINTYTIVKVGTQYWTAENLRATKYVNGTPIDAISETQTDEWKGNTAGAYLIDGDADWVKLAGLLYNGFVITNENGIAPEGWAVPTQAEMSKLRTAGGPACPNFKSTLTGTWDTGCTGNNMTNFNGIATGYYSTATGLTATATDAYFWSCTSYYDALARGNVIDYFRLTAKGTNAVVSTTITGGHSPQFGHSIRLIRK